MAAPTSSPFKSILMAGFVAGTLDIIAAITILGKMNAGGVLRYIASGFFGAEAFRGGPEMVWFGLLFHFLIAFSFTIFYFLIFPYVPFLRKYRLGAGLAYGLFVWVVMNRIVVPLSQIPPVPFQWDRALLNLVILVVCVGLPISLLISRFNSSKS